jgi:hypothetical protein
VRRGALLAAPLALAVFTASIAFAASSDAAPLILDRTVARFHDPEASETAASLRFVMMRELIVEAWLTAYEKTPNSSPPNYDDKHLREALERHVIEAVLGDRPLVPSAEKRVETATAEARLVATIAVGGETRLKEALERATGIAGGGAVELDSVLRRRARAELYLETAVAQPVQLSDAELRAAYAKAPEILASKPYDEIVPTLRAFVRASRLRDIAQGYYQAVRARLHLAIVQS